MSVPQSSRKSLGPHRAFPCQLHFTHCRVSQGPGTGRSGSAARLRTAPGSLHSAGAPGQRQAPTQGLAIQAQHGAAGLAGPSRREGTPGGFLGQSSLPRGCQRCAGRGATSLPMALSAPHPPTHPHCDPEKPARVCCGSSNRTILMHVTNTPITRAGARPFPRHPLGPSAGKRSHPRPSAACAEAGLGCCPVGRAPLGEAVGRLRHRSAFRQQE